MMPEVLWACTSGRNSLQPAQELPMPLRFYTRCVTRYIHLRQLLSPPHTPVADSTTATNAAALLHLHHLLLLLLVVLLVVVAVVVVAVAVAAAAVAAATATATTSSSTKNPSISVRFLMLVHLLLLLQLPVSPRRPAEQLPLRHDCVACYW